MAAVNYWLLKLNQSEGAPNQFWLGSTNQETVYVANDQAPQLRLCLYAVHYGVYTMAAITHSWQLP